MGVELSLHIYLSKKEGSAGIVGRAKKRSARDGGEGGIYQTMRDPWDMSPLQAWSENFTQGC